MSSRKVLMMLVLPGLSAWAEVVSVDVQSWAEVGTGEANGWVVSGIDCYSGEKGARFNTEGEYALSPKFLGIVTQLVMNIRSSGTNMTRYLTAVPVEANCGARNLPAAAAKSYEIQTFVWRLEEGVRQFLLQNVTGRGNAGWGIRSLDVYADRIEAPCDLCVESNWSDALSVAWTPDSRAVSNELHVARMIILPEKGVLLKEWDFTSLTNASKSTVYFRDLPDIPSSLDDVGGTALNLQGTDGGHLQIGTTMVGGTMTLPLPSGTGRTAVLRWFRLGTDGDFLAFVDYGDYSENVSEYERLHLGTVASWQVVTIPDDAAYLILRSEKGDDRIRVEDVKIVTDYVSESVMTNDANWRRTVKNACTVKGLECGDYIWRVRSFDEAGTVSVWSEFVPATLDPTKPKRPVSGLAAIIR